MNKKEEIKQLKQELQLCKEISILNKSVLEPYKKLYSDRGDKMKALMSYIKSIDPHVFGLIYPREFDEWFDKDGNPTK